jgi:hypothetical protein
MIATASDDQFAPEVHVKASTGLLWAFRVKEGD